MSGGSGEDQLARRRIVTVILRLLVGPEGQVEQGEVVDLAGASHGRFTRWLDLGRLVEVWLESVRPADHG